MTEIIAKVAVENTAYSFDEAFDYAIPDFLRSEVKAGVRVLCLWAWKYKKTGHCFCSS